MGRCGCALSWCTGLSDGDGVASARGNSDGKEAVGIDDGAAWAWEAEHGGSQQLLFIFF